MSARGSAAQLPKGYEPEPLAQYGTLDVIFNYNSSDQRMSVTITALTDIPSLKRMGNISWQVHLVLLPTKNREPKLSSSVAPVPCSQRHFTLAMSSRRWSGTMPSGSACTASAGWKRRRLSEKRCSTSPNSTCKARCRSLSYWTPAATYLWVWSNVMSKNCEFLI